MLGYMVEFIKKYNTKIILTTDIVIYSDVMR